MAPVDLAPIFDVLAVDVAVSDGEYTAACESLRLLAVRLAASERLVAELVKTPGLLSAAASLALSELVALGPELGLRAG